MKIKEKGKKIIFLFLERAIYIIIKIISKTYRFEFHNEENLLKAKQQSQIPNTYFMALWHQNLVGTIFAHTGIPHCVLVSPSMDGDLVAYVLDKLKHRCIRGSSHRQYFSAMKLLLKTMKNEQLPCAITVDAPKGPAHIVKRGIIDLSKLTGSVILPTFAKSESNWVFTKSWDKFRLPRPFSLIKVYYGSCIEVPKNTPLTEYNYYTNILTQQLCMMEESFSKNI